jgi:hypothetical protein
VDRFFHGEPHPYRASLSDVTVVMMFKCVLMVESSCQATMGWIPTLECLLPDARGRLWLCLVWSSIKWPSYMRTLLLGHSRDTRDPRAWLPRARARAALGHKEELDRGGRW